MRKFRPVRGRVFPGSRTAYIEGTENGTIVDFEVPELDEWVLEEHWSHLRAWHAVHSYRSLEQAMCLSKQFMQRAREHLAVLENTASATFRLRSRRTGDVILMDLVA